MHTKILLRSLTFHSRYQQWQENSRNLHMEMLRGSYANELFGLGSGDLVYEHSATFSRIIWKPGELSIEDLDFMMDYFLDVMLKNNYYVNLSDERIEIFDKGLKLTIQRHYLKPDNPYPNNDLRDSSAMFGTIYIEHQFNSKHNALLISANYYGENKFLSFERLMEVLLG